MARVIVTGPAFSDYSRILYGLAREAGYITATKYDDGFKELFDTLSEFPGIGAPRPKLGRNVRLGIVYPYLNIYRVSDDADTVTVIRIVYGRRKITRKLLDRP